MKKFNKRRNIKVGTPAGTLQFTGTKKINDIQLNIIKYNSIRHKIINNVNIVNNDYSTNLITDNDCVNWFKIHGLHDVNLVDNIGKSFNIHPLTLEDILNTECFPKIEFFSNYIFIELRLLSYSDVDNDIVSEQVSLILGNNFVISFLESDTSVFNSIIERIKINNSRIATLNSDFLFYTLLDTVIDNYFVLLERIEENIENIEMQALQNPTQETVKAIQIQKHNLIYIYRSLLPLRENFRKLETESNTLIANSTNPYIRDLYDHTIQILETVDSLREVLSSSQDIYLSSLSNKMNEIMKLLTIIGTIFLPLTFIAGVYGMNFKFMPELEWNFGYIFCLGIMLITAIVMIIYFRIKKWI